MADQRQRIETKIWREDPAPDNPFAADACYCAGYDVYGDLLGNISWPAYVYLLFRGELPSTNAARLLEILAVAVANPGIRDHSVRAAMNAGAGGSTRASMLMAAIAVGAGNLGGGREIHQAVHWWRRLGMDSGAWLGAVGAPPAPDPLESWPAMEHIPGFDPNGTTCTATVRNTLDKFVQCAPDGALSWLRSNRSVLEAAVGYPLALSGVVGAAFFDLGFDADEAEITYLFLRLPGAAAHALEQQRLGWRRYPFFGDVLKPMADGEYRDLLASWGIGA